MDDRFMITRVYKQLESSQSIRSLLSLKDIKTANERISRTKRVLRMSARTPALSMWLTTDNSQLPYALKTLHIGVFVPLKQQLEKGSAYDIAAEVVAQIRLLETQIKTEGYNFRIQKIAKQFDIKTAQDWYRAELGFIYSKIESIKEE